MATKAEHEVLLAEWSTELSADVLLCNSGIERDLDEDIIRMCQVRRRRENIALVLVTEGGSPDCAYRIARILQCLYQRVYCVISGYCKSAGTLVALGAHEIIFGHHGELGPLDVQMAKKDELMESESGLTVMTALTALHEKALLAFEHFFLQTRIHSGGRISVRTASQIATELTKSLFAPISDQIDPLHVGEAWRSMTIAKAYGERLMQKSQNFTSERLEDLISEYPSHGFVIDRLEASKIFKNVREATPTEQAWLDLCGSVAISPSRKPIIKFLTEEAPVEKEHADTTESTDGQQSDVQPPSETGAHAKANATGIPPEAK